MRGWWSLAGALSLATLSVTPSVRAARPVAALQPSSAWVVNYKDNSCALQRSFGDPQHQVFMELDDYTLRDQFRTTVITAAFGETHNDVTAGFEPGTARPAKELVQAKFAEGRQGVIFDLSLNPANGDEQPDDLPTTDPSDAARRAREQAVTSFFVGGAFDKDLVLETGSLTAPMDTLHKCADDLERHLGLDPQVLKTIVTQAKPKREAQWAQRIQSEYPDAALRAEQSAVVRFRLIIDAAGKVMDCYARPEGQLQVFGDSACSIFKSDAQFDPARDAAGSAVPSIFIVRIAWSLS